MDLVADIMQKRRSSEASQIPHLICAFNLFFESSDDVLTHCTNDMQPV